MERLTSYKNECNREMICRYEDCMVDGEHCPHLNEDSCHCLQEVLEKLAEYEDLEERLCKIYGECDGFLKTVVEHLERHENVDIPEPVFKARLLTDGEVDRWEEYKDLDKQGKLLKLPCAVGDTIYEIYSDNIKEHKVNEVSTHSIWIDNMYFDHADIGQNIFLTKEEAEAALKGMEGGRS